ncbi:jg6651, partial [Pararge aegeria aegeria]
VEAVTLRMQMSTDKVAHYARHPAAEAYGAIMGPVRDAFILLRMFRER